VTGWLRRASPAAATGVDLGSWRVADQHHLRLSLVGATDEVDDARVPTMAASST
jgi:hypothetical protein